MTRAQILAQIADARRQMQHLAKLYPVCFDERGKPIVAALRLPALRRENNHD